MNGEGTLKVWRELANSGQLLEDDFDRMVGALDESLQKAARRISIAVEVEGFSRWFHELIRREPPNPMMKALFLGLGERTEKSFQNYTVGKEFFGYLLGGDSLDTVGRESDRYCWRPEGEWLLCSVEGGFWDAVGREITEDWRLMQGVSIVCSRHIFRCEGRKVLANAGIGEIRNGLGFPEGDLFEISVGKNVDITFATKYL